MTLFTTIYDKFLLLITDDIYLQDDDNEMPGVNVWTYEDTLNEMQSFLINAIPLFEFPRINLDDYTLNDIIVENDEVDDTSFFHADLSTDEQNILANLMVSLWLGRQINSIENIKAKYSSSDFKMTSQATLLNQLLKLEQNHSVKTKRLQRLYKRREKDDEGIYRSTWGELFSGSTFDN